MMTEMSEQPSLKIALAIDEMNPRQLDEFLQVIETLQERHPSLSFRERLRMWAGKMIAFAAERGDKDAVRRQGDNWDKLGENIQ